MLNSATLAVILLYILSAILFYIYYRFDCYILCKKKSWYRRKNTYNKKWLQKNSSYFFNYKLHCIICRNGCCTYCRLRWLQPSFNRTIFLFIFNICGRRSWIFYCKVNYIQKIFLFKGRQNGKSRSLCRNMRTVLHIYRKLTDSSVYNRSISLPLLILTKWYYEWKLKSRNLNNYNYFICTSCHTFCYNGILPYGKKCGLQKQSSFQIL